MPNYHLKCTKCKNKEIKEKAILTDWKEKDLLCSKCKGKLVRDWNSETKTFSGLNEEYNKTMQPRFDYAKKDKKIF